jgi:hypothetical protein
MALPADPWDRAYARADAALRVALTARGLRVRGRRPVRVTSPAGRVILCSPAEWDRYCAWRPDDAVAELAALLAGTAPPSVWEEADHDIRRL